MNGLKVKIVYNTISPRLQELLRNSGTCSRKVLLSMGASLQSWVVQSFADASRRIEPWAAKKDGTPSTLQKSTKLRQSIRLRSVTEKEAEIGTDTVYSPYHQFGTRRGLPRRPFFPFTKAGKMSDAAEASIYAAGRKAFDSSLKK